MPREVSLPVLFPGLFPGALFDFLLSWGNLSPPLFTTGADTTVLEYLYAKMVAGYTPSVPVPGSVSTIGAAILLIGDLWAHPHVVPRTAGHFDLTTRGTKSCLHRSQAARFW